MFLGAARLLGVAVFYNASWSVLAPTLRTLFRVKFQGRRNIPKKGPAILASNHLSFLDHAMVALGTPRQIFFISKNQHFQSPLRRYVFSSWGVIPLKRGEGDKEAFEEAVKALQRGKLFCIYPEGTRSLDGKLHKGHTGVARLAAITKAPVVPAAMIGTFEAMPKGVAKPKLLPITVKYGKPLDFSAYHGRENDRDAMREVTDKIMRAIAALSGQEYVDEYQFNPEVKTHAKAAAHK
jgi:1-acyl-sn-glycerol-3-phosphate acyltransferase